MNSQNSAIYKGGDAYAIFVGRVFFDEMARNVFGLPNTADFIGVLVRGSPLIPQKEK